MTSREFIHGVLANTPGISSVVGERIFQQGSLLSAQTVKPYIVYTMGNNTDEGMADLDSFRPSRQFFQVYYHDLVGDYSRIDLLVQATKQAFLAAATTDDVCGVQYLETSRDLDDPTLESIMRYSRFQLALAR